MSDNLLDRAFEASAPNQKWVADVTYIRTAEGWLHVAAVVLSEGLAAQRQRRVRACRLGARMV